MSDNTTAAGAVTTVTVAGTEIPGSHLQAFSVDSDMFMPCMAQVTLTNQDDGYSKSKVGDPVTIKVNSEQTTIFDGEIVGIEPRYQGGSRSSIVLRCMNKFHRMLRGKGSYTYTNQTLQAIFNQVVSRTSGLSLDYDTDASFTLPSVYQHAQSDMEFIRTWAGRIGAYVWGDGNTLNIKKPDFSTQSGPELKVDFTTDSSLRSFTPRVNSTDIVNQVQVKGWNPETKALIVGSAEVTSSPLGQHTSAAGSGDLTKDITYTVDHPIWSKEEADCLAKAKLQDASLSYISAEAELSGNPSYKMGTVVKITANSNDDSDPFNGLYYIIGITHRQNGSRGKDSVYLTTLRLQRDAQGQ